MFDGEWMKGMNNVWVKFSTGASANLVIVHCASLLAFNLLGWFILWLTYHAPKTSHSSFDLYYASPYTSISSG